VALVVCGSSVHAAVGSLDDPPAQGTRPADVVSADADSMSIETLLYKGIVQYDLETGGGAELFPLMATAVAAGASGKETPEILRSLALAGVGHERARQRGGGSDALVGWRVDDVTVHAARAIGRQKELRDDGALLAALADGRIWDDYTRSDNAAMSDRRFRREAGEGTLTVPMARSVILDAYTSAFHGLPQMRVVDELFAGELGVSPGSPLPVLADAATARFGETIPHILERRNDEDELVAVHGRTLDAVRADHMAMMKVLSERLAKLEAGVDQIEKGTKALTARAEKEHEARRYALMLDLVTREGERAKKESDLKRAGAKSIMDLTVALVARKNTEVARGLQRVGTASMLAMDGATKIGLAVRTKGLSRLGKGLGTAGGVADLLRAVLVLTGSPPQRDKATVAALKELSQHMLAIRFEMRDMFELLDRRVQAVYEGVVASLRAIMDGRVETLNTLRAMVEGLRDLEAVQLDMYRTTLSAADAILTGVERTSVGACLERADAVRVDMTKEEFAACVSAIRAIGTQGSLERRQQPPPMTNQGLLAANAVNARQTPELFVRVIGEEFRRRARQIRPPITVPNPPAPAVSTAGPLVSPYHWIGLANMYRAFLEEWADDYYGDIVKPDGEFRRVMRAYRQGLRELIESIAADIANYEPASADEAADTVLAGMVRDIRQRHGEVVDAFERETVVVRETRRDRGEPLDYLQSADRWQRVQGVRGIWDAPSVRRRISYGDDTSHCSEKIWELIGLKDDPERYDSPQLAYKPPPGTVNDRPTTFAELSLPFVLAPHEPRNKERTAYLFNSVRSWIDPRIPRPVVSLAALGIGRVKVCVVGLINEEAVYDINPEKRGTSVWAVTEATVAIEMRWERSRCSEEVNLLARSRRHYRSEMALAVGHTGLLGLGRPLVSNRDGSPSKKNDGELDDAREVPNPAGRVPAPGTPVALRNRWYAMDKALDRAVAAAANQLRGMDDDDFQGCRDVYRRSYQEHHVKALSDVVQRAGVRKAIEDYNVAVDLANMYIRGWFRIALRGAARDFDKVWDIVLGFRRLPRWDQGAGEHYMDVGKRVAALIDAYEGALEDPELHRIARHYAGYPGLTDTEYPGIDYAR